MLSSATQVRNHWSKQNKPKLFEDSGQSNSLVVEEEEEGGLEELLAEFNSGRYQYGLTGVQSEGKGVKVKYLIMNSNVDIVEK